MKRTESKSAEIKQHLIHSIKHRHFKDKLPSENQLSDRFNVSRTTARKVLSQLEAEGLIERIQGKGTFVKKRDLSSGYFKIQPSKLHAKQLNAQYSCEVMEVTMLHTPPPEIAHILNYHQQTVFVRRLHFFDGRPVRYESRYLRGDMCGGIFWEDLKQQSIHELLVSKYDLPLTSVKQRLTAELMPGEVAKIFGESEGYPAFHIKRTTYTLDNPVTFVEYFIRGELAFEDTHSL
ncbi:MAG: GntR family transcriptional regulator [Desulfobacterales bacterium]|nr:GntR family transcriptional regulator [Desulfobacterales bacterium]